MATNRHLNSDIRGIITIIQIVVVFAVLSTVLFVGFNTLVNVFYSIVLTFITLLGVVNVVFTLMECTEKLCCKK